MVVVPPWTLVLKYSGYSGCGALAVYFPLIRFADEWGTRAWGLKEEGPAGAGPFSFILNLRILNSIKLVALKNENAKWFGWRELAGFPPGGGLDRNFGMSSFRRSALRVCVGLSALGRFIGTLT
jgi:hypothetical protein